jgi:hypothetical protein
MNPAVAGGSITKMFREYNLELLSAGPRAPALVHSGGPNYLRLARRSEDRSKGGT